jgi:hypothetical protein
MATFLTGSISLEKLKEQIKAQHSAVAKGNDEKTYINIKVWLNDEPDKFGNEGSIQLNALKDKETVPVYLGNLKVRSGASGQAQASTGTSSQTSTAGQKSESEEDIF